MFLILVCFICLFLPRLYLSVPAAFLEEQYVSITVISTSFWSPILRISGRACGFVLREYLIFYFVCKLLMFMLVCFYV